MSFSLMDMDDFFHLLWSTSESRVSFPFIKNEHLTVTSSHMPVWHNICENIKFFSVTKIITFKMILFYLCNTTLEFQSKVDIEHGYKTKYMNVCLGRSVYMSVWG